MTKKTYSVYHIFDNRTDGSLTDGYIGYTSKPVKYRLFQHRYTGYNTGATTSYARPMYLKLAEIPEEFIGCRTIATFDSEGLAADYERHLRPKSNMGWNKTKGGQKYTYNKKLVIVKPDGTEETFNTFSAVRAAGYNDGNFSKYLNGRAASHNNGCKGYRI